MRYPITIICMLFISCTGNQNKTDSTIDGIDTPATITEKEADSTAIETVAGCYMQVLQRDTFTAVLQQDGANVTGRLKFDNYEKDGSSGSVKGTIEGDVIKLKYSFQSEGMNSVMDVYFKKENDKLVRGIGEMNTKGDTAYFTSPASITYPSSTVLKKVSCDLVD